MEDKEYVTMNFNTCCSKLIRYNQIDNLVGYEKFLIKKYSSRPYHNFGHIAKGLVKIESIGNQYTKDLIEIYQINIKYYEELYFSWIVHDIYSGCPDEVTLSGIFALNVISNLGLNLYDEVVYKIIRETSIENALREKTIYGLPECDLIHDINFMGIGDKYQNFLIDDGNVEKEYSHIEDFRERRVDFFHSLLDMKKIYRTKLFEDRNDVAIDNIRRIIREKYSH